MKTLFTVYLIFLVASCDSPLRHMRPERDRGDSGSQIIDLRTSGDGLEDSLEETLTNSLFSAIKVTWLDGPYGNPDVFSSLEIQFLDEESNAIQLPLTYKLYLQADMGMAHGIASSGEFYTEDDSKWINDEIAFFMSGDYLFTLLIVDENFNEVGRAKWQELF